MDPLSITAAAIGFSTAAITAYKGIKNFVDKTINAPKEIESIWKDTTLIYTTISNLQDALNEPRICHVVNSDALAQKHVQDLMEPLRRCHTTLECINDKLDEHLRTFNNGQDFRPRIQWWKARSDFQKLLIRLQSDKEALSLSMVGLNTFVCSSDLG